MIGLNPVLTNWRPSWESVAEEEADQIHGSACSVIGTSFDPHTMGTMPIAYYALHAEEEDNFQSCSRSAPSSPRAPSRLPTIDEGRPSRSWGKSFRKYLLRTERKKR